MSKYVRIEAAPTADNPESKHFHFDLLLDNNNMIQGDHPIFGTEGVLGKGGDSRPFVLHDDGIVDYGDEWGSGNDRYGRLSLREISIREGQTFQYRSYDGSEGVQHFRITIVENLSENNR